MQIGICCHTMRRRSSTSTSIGPSFGLRNRFGSILQVQGLVFGLYALLLFTSTCTKCCMGQYYYYYNYKLLLHPSSHLDNNNDANNDNDTELEQFGDDMTDPNDYNQDPNNNNRSSTSNYKFVRMHKFDLQTAKAIARSLEAAQAKEEQQQQQDTNVNVDVTTTKLDKISTTTTTTTTSTTNDDIKTIQTEATTIIASASI